MAQRSAIDYPSPEHARAAESVVEFFSVESGVAAVLLVGACARRKATRDSDLDILVLRAPVQQKQIS
ncbi:MAG: nucleotidyltransferase domain-containing protein [Armatimonadota bacterium]